jgi:hypothetical protein
MLSQRTARRRHAVPPRVSLYAVRQSVLVFLAAFLLSFVCQVHAHHSFAIYDIDSKIQRTGVLTKFVFSQPHIQLVLKVEREDGSTETWEIESMAPRRWDNFNHSRDVTRVGEAVTILGWPARDGSDRMVLSTIVTARGTTVILEEVRQRRARENIPDVTIRRD